MSTLDGRANAKTPISDAEAETREKIYTGKLCTRCNQPYLYSLSVKPDGTCTHDGTVKLSRWADKREIERISDRLAREEKQIKP